MRCLDMSTGDVWLLRDDGMPADLRPTFQFYFPSAYFVALGWTMYTEAEGLEKSDPAKVLPKLVECIRLRLAGWRNVRTTDPAVAAIFGVTLPDDGTPAELPYKSELIHAALDIDAIWELARRWITAMRKRELELLQPATPAT